MNVHGNSCKRRCSNAKAKQQLGWKPRPIEVAIQEAVDFYKAQYQRSKKT
jgi:nucleoside-diphosphate-sugar epimerase